MRLPDTVRALDTFLERASADARRTPLLQRFTLFTRILLVMGFLPTGMIKVLGRPFTTIGTDTPVGYFFDAMHGTGPWWQFIGLAQVVPCLLLLIPATNTLGAVLFFPVMINIVVLTVGLSFQGTAAVTSLMLLATIYLLLWDYDRVRGAWLSVIGAPARTLERDRPVLAHASRLEVAAFAVLAVSGTALFSVMRSLLPAQLTLPCLVAGVIGGLMLLVSWVRCLRSLRAEVSAA